MDNKQEEKVTILNGGITITGEGAKRIAKVIETKLLIKMKAANKQSKPS